MSVFKNDRLIRVLNYLPVDRIPVWMMRQAGRTDPEYNQLRKNDGRALEELFADPEIAIKISLFPKRLGVDAIIMFQDILTPLTPMGAGFHFDPGPVLEKPLRTFSQKHYAQLIRKYTCKPLLKSSKDLMLNSRENCQFLVLQARRCHLHFF